MAIFDDYLQNASDPQRKEFARIRGIVRDMVPDAEETMSYGLPTYKYKKRPLLYVGAFKNHMSFFPTPGPIEHFQEKLEGYKVSKGTIQFTTDNPLPEGLIREIIAARLQDIENAGA